MVPILPKLRLCPACTRRNRAAEIVDPHCPVCDGVGTLKMGAAALTTHTAEAVGEAILLTLEARARLADQALTLSDDRLGAIRGALELLHTAGLLGEVDTPLGAISAPRRSRTAQQLTEELTEGAGSSTDRAVATATPHLTAAHERPGALGLPVLSRHGDPSSLARLTDPADPHRSTRRDAAARDRAHCEAKALADAAEEVGGGGSGPPMDPLFPI